MVLVGIDERSARLRSKVKLRPPILVALAFWFAAALPLLVPAHTGVAHYASSALFFAIGIALSHSSFRLQRRTISFAEGTFQADDRIFPLANAHEIALTGSEGDAPEATYRAELVFEGGDRQLLLEDHEPGRVVRDLIELLQHLRLPVRRGWGLPEGIEPWESRYVSASSSRSSEVKSEVIEVVSHPSLRRPAYALIIGALVLGTVQGILVAPALRGASPVSTLSIGLALLSVLAVLSLGLVVLSRRFVVKLGPHVAVELRLLGLGLRTLAAEPAPVRGAWAVSPDGRSPRHVLIATEGAPLSVPCEGPAAAALAHRLVAEAR